MELHWVRRRHVVFWQIAVLLFGTTWLLAPALNHSLSYRTSLISQYETGAQAYSTFFRLGDVLAGGLILGLGFVILKSKRVTAAYLTLLLGIGMLLDPLLTTSCRITANTCTEYYSTAYLLHAIETVLTASAYFFLSLYDSWARKKIVSVIFVAFQIAYGLLFLSQFANAQHFNTLSQYIYQLSLIVWIAWFGRDLLINKSYAPPDNEIKLVRFVAAIWAFLNGILAILLSFSHIRLLGKIKGIYFAGDSAWLAQHGVIVGVVMLYLSRQIARGELRARQLFLWIVGIEALKYGVITPSLPLVLLYTVTFCLLFVFKDDFDRGTVPVTWHIKLQDFVYMLISLLVATLVGLLALDRDDRISRVTGRAFAGFFDYAARSHVVEKAHLRSALLANTFTAFLAASVMILLWIIFRPTKPRSVSADYNKVNELLQKHSRSSEDYFKKWPKDKQYFWSHDKSGFIAYKIEGPVAFALADPICQKNQRKNMINNFTVWCRSRGLRCCFLPIYGSSAHLYTDLNEMQIGSSAIIDISRFIRTTSNDKWWRWQKNRAKKQNYIYDFSKPPHSKNLLRQLKIVSDQWLLKDGRKERGFALGHFNKDYLQKCIIHFLKDNNGQITAFTNQMPMFNPSETATVDLLRHKPNASNSMPYLLFKTIEQINMTGRYKYFDLGFVPFASVEAQLLKIAKVLSAGRFSAKGLEQFKNKFDPDWQANYMGYDGDLADLALIALNLERSMDL